MADLSLKKADLMVLKSIKYFKWIFKALVARTERDRKRVLIKMLMIVVCSSLRLLKILVLGVSSSVRLLKILLDLL